MTAPTPPRRWTAADITDQTGRTFVVTGANSGLGLVTAAQLAAHGARVVLAVRDRSRGEQAAATIRGDRPGADLAVEHLDLLDLGSVRTFAERLADQDTPVDGLINNAGIAMVDRGRSPEGVETHLAANHMGHFALTGLLLPLLRRAPAPRVVTVSSLVHEKATLDLDDLGAERSWSRMGAYSTSKLANALFGVELARREEHAEHPVLSLIAHPGYANTPMQRKGPGVLGVVIRMLGNLAGQDPEQGALPQLYAATGAGLPPATYIGPDGRGGRSGHPTIARLSDAARDPELAARLWEASERVTGVRYDEEIGERSPSSNTTT